METRTFAAGEILFEEGAEAGFVGYVRDGEAEVVRRHGGETVVLGHVGAGEYVGEMAAIEGRAHSATVRATTALTVELIPTDAFLAQAAGNSEVALKLLFRMSARLRQVDRAYADAVAGGVDETPAPWTEGPRVSLLPGSPHTERLLGSRPDPRIEMPFVVGRTPSPHEQGPLQRVSLQLRDSQPFRLSRAHFLIVLDGGRVWVHDLDSYLGTIVNGLPIGSAFSADRTALRPGENTVVAGGSESPFVFRVVVDY